MKNRQTGGLHIVGSNDATAFATEKSRYRCLRRCSARVGNGPFLFAAQPDVAGFGLYGQRL